MTQRSSDGVIIARPGDCIRCWYDEGIIVPATHRLIVEINHFGNLDYQDYDMCAEHYATKMKRMLS